MPTAEDYISAWFGGQQQPEDKGVTGHVMDFLSALNAPNRALYGGILGGLSDKPGETAWEGMKKGWSGETDLGLADLIGLPKPQSEDEWAAYIAKGIPYLLANALGDPTNLLFAPAKGAGLVGRGVKALGVPEGRSIAGLAASPLVDPLVEKIAASGLGKAFMHGTGNEAMDLTNAGLRRQAGETRLFVDEQSKDIAAKLADMGITAERNPELYHALEWGPEALPSDLPAGILDLFKPLRGKRLELFNLENQLRQAKKMEPIPNITGGDYEYMPHYRTDVKASTNPESRTLFRWKYADEPGAFVIDDTTGKPFISADKPKFLKEAGITGNEAKGWIDTATGRAVERTPQVSLQDILTGDVGMKAEQFITDPTKALGASTTAAQKRINFLQMIDEGEKAGLIRPIENAPDNFRAINIPKLKESGLSEMAFEPKYANFLENQAKGAFDRTTPIGAIGDVLERFNQGAIGQGLGKFTDLFKATTLPLHPGFHAGNIGSGLFQQATTGGISPFTLPLRNAEAIVTAVGKGADIIPQLKEAGLDALHEAKIRGLVPESSWFGSEAGKPSIFGKAGELPVIKQIGQAQDFGFKVGGAIENTQKLAVFINELKGLPADFATMPKEAQARLLDAASMKAHFSLGDYSPGGGWTGLEKQLDNLIPFYKWQRIMAGQTLEGLTQYPHRLAATGRALDTFLQPMDPQDKAIMDPWAREQSPIQGIGPWNFGQDERGMPQMALAGRYLPWGNIEQFLKRPVDFAESIVNPGIKSPLELGTNYSSFKNRNIDELSGGFPGSLINPLTGGPYQGASEQMFGFTLPAAYQYVLSQMPGGRYLREANELGRAAGLYEDKYKDVSPDMGTFASWYATGGKQYPFDRMKAMLNRQKEADKEKAAIRHDINFATMKGDTSRMMRDMEFLQEQQNEAIGKMWGVGP